MYLMRQRLDQPFETVVGQLTLSVPFFPGAKIGSCGFGEATGEGCGVYSAEALGEAEAEGDALGEADAVGDGDALGDGLSSSFGLGVGVGVVGDGGI